MSRSTEQASSGATLRGKAEAQLLSGTAPTAGPWSMGVDALQLLHRLSSDPSKAEDAQKLLHELQVHQVEIDLQNEQLVANERLSVGESDFYRTLYDHAPFGYFVVTDEGLVIQANLAAARFVARDRDTLEGQRIDTFVSARGRPRLLGLITSVARSGGREGCLVEVHDVSHGPRSLQFVASLLPGEPHILVACCEASAAH